jgi:hypothetical protein
LIPKVSPADSSNFFVSISAVHSIAKHMPIVKTDSNESIDSLVCFLDNEYDLDDRKERLVHRDPALLTGVRWKVACSGLLALMEQARKAEFLGCLNCTVSCHVDAYQNKDVDHLEFSGPTLIMLYRVFI